ncbi:MAG: ATP-binding protein [Desulfuromonadaceae bacterium]|nr:ATP-binding protein [Desulfuromonadaceae bacterium]MDD2856565.1 ATP-binding protein [Desulfuromonadaceae bacterium]
MTIYDDKKNETFFAPAERQKPEAISLEVQTIAGHAVVDEIMKASGGLFAVLNEQRQIVAINEAFLQTIGVKNSGDVMGLRLGEYVNCVHACDMPGGCGTSKYCSTCGAAIAIVTALNTSETVERRCILTTERDYKELDLYFNVRSHPIEISGRKYLLLFMQDISIQQQWAYLENTFLHDISNTLQGLVGAAASLTDEYKVTRQRIDTVSKLSQRLAQEVAIQKSLSTTLSTSYTPIYNNLSTINLLDEIQKVFQHHPAAKQRLLDICPPEMDIAFVSDHALVSRILVNMIINALEATPAGERVKLNIETTSESVEFCVWNRTVIPEDIVERIFQRNFTTKEGFGHGLGTYSMKLFGEKILGGKVSFTTDEESGTIFRFALQV